MRGILLLSLALVAGITALFLIQPGAKVGQGVTRRGLLEVRPGMSIEEVVERIGQPLYEDKASKALVYGEPSLVPGGGLEIGVFVTDGRVKGIYVEEYDLGVYRYQEGKSPQIWKPKALDRLPD